MSSPSSSRPSSVVTLKDDFSSQRDDDFLAVFSCPVCLGLYVNPKILPKCGHSFCLKCIQAIVANNVDSSKASSIICPECRTESSVGYGRINPENLQTNVQIQRAVEFVRESAQNAARRSADPDDTCPHLALIKHPAVCGHCKGNYCQACFFRHMEKVRVEIAWVGSGFEERWKTAVEKLAANADSITSAIEDQVKKAQEKVEQEMTAFEATVKESIRQNRKRLLDKARKIGDEQLAKVRRLLETSKDTPDSLKINIRKVSNTSLLHCSTKELSKLYTKVEERDREIFDLEEMQAVPKLGQLSFQPDDHLKDVLKQIEESGKESLNWMIGGHRASADGSQKADGDELPHEIMRYHNAIKSGDLATVKEMLSRLPPPCHAYACEHRDDTDFKQTPLMQAAENGHLEVVRFFVEEKKANLFAKNNEEKLSLAIHLAAEEGHLDVVTYLLERCDDLVEVGDDYGNTPLCRAVMTGQMEVVKFLVETKHANVEARGQHGRTPLLLAAETGQLEMVKYLLSQEADLKAKDTITEVGIIFAATEFGQLGVIRYLLEIDPDCVQEEIASSRNSVLMVAVEKNQLEIAKLFVKELKLDLNKKNKKGLTPLMVASSNGNLEMVKFLLENGADLEAKCKPDKEREDADNGNLAIHFAAKFGHEGVVGFLLDKNSDLIDVKNKELKTPLAIAKAGKHDSVIRLLNERATKLGD